MRVIVVGNATVDETYAVDALPRAGESLTGELRLRDVGGKGANVASVVARCGVGARLVAALGDDGRGAWLRERLGTEPLEADLATLPGAPTDVSLIYVTPSGDNAIVTTVATTRALPLARAVAALDDAARGDTVVLQGNLPAATTLETIRAARARGLAVALNPSPTADWLGEAIPLADTVFLNEGEARALVGEAGPTALDALLGAGVRRVVLTRGAGGALLGRADGAGSTSSIEVPAAAADVVDTTGAGDTFLAVALASAALRGTSLDGCALVHAAHAAAVTIGRHGTLSAFPDTATLGAILARD